MFDKTQIFNLLEKAGYHKEVSEDIIKIFFENVNPVIDGLKYNYSEKIKSLELLIKMEKEITELVFSKFEEYILNNISQLEAIKMLFDIME